MNPYSPESLDKMAEYLTKGIPLEVWWREFGRSLDAVRMRAARLSRERNLPRAKRMVKAVDGAELQPSEVQIGEKRTTTPKETTIDLTTYEPVKTLDDLIRVCQLDPVEWEIFWFQAGTWTIYAKDSSNEIQERTAYKVSARMRPRKGGPELRQILRDHIEDARAAAPTYAKWVRDVRLGSSQRRCLAVVGAFDAHLGKLAWPEETGDAPYDLQIAVETYKAAIADLIHKLRPYNLERIAFVVGQDFLHVDTEALTTTKGTRVDTDGRFPKIYREARRLLVGTIEQLLLVADVDVIVAPGNHDQLSSYTLGDSVEAWFHNEPRVQVDNSASHVKYYSYGKVLFGVTHGEDAKPEVLAANMPVEEPHLWAASTWRELLLGHLHTQSLKEVHGVMVRRLSSLSSTDKWHRRHGYIGNKRLAEAYIYDREDGLVGHVIHAVKPIAKEQEWKEPNLRQVA